MAKPAFFLEKGEEYEAAEEFLGEVADGLVGLGLGFGGFFSGDGEAFAGVCGALRGEQLGKKGFVVELVFREELLGEFFHGEGVLDVLEGEVFVFYLDFSVLTPL